MLGSAIACLAIAFFASANQGQSGMTGANAKETVGSLSALDVRAFGAVGDCVADDTMAIRMAFVQSQATGIPVYFSKGCYLTGTIPYYGQSFFGSGSSGTTYTSIIRGKPGQDILQMPDAADGDKTPIAQHTSIHDMGFQVDGSVNAAGTFHSRNITLPDSTVFTIGNCALAMPNRDGSHTHGSTGFLLSATLGRLRVDQYNGPNRQNSTCGFMFQIAPYGSTFEDIVINETEYGMIQLPWATNAQAGWYSGDGNVYRRISTQTHLGFLAVDGAHNNMDACQFYTSGPGDMGFYLMDFPGNRTGTSYDWTIRDLYVESNGKTPTRVNWIHGQAHTIIGGDWKQDNSSLSWTQWDASWSRAVNLGNEAGTTPGYDFRVGGNGNVIELNSYHRNQVEDTGIGNYITSNRRNGYARPQVLNSAKVPGTFAATNAAAGKGLAGTYRSDDDLLLFASQIGNEFSLNSLPITKDASIPLSGEYFTASPAGSWNAYTFYDGTHALRVGETFPRTKIRIYAYVRAGQNTSQQWNAGWCAASCMNDTSRAGSATLKIGKSWSVVFLDADFSSAPAGSPMFMQVFASSPATPLYVGWIATRPWAADVLVTGTGIFNGGVAAAGPITAPTINATSGVQVNGVNLLPVLSGTTGKIGGRPLAAGACATGTAIVAQATTAMAVMVTPVTYPGDGLFWNGYVSSANTVTVKLCAAGATTPEAIAFNVRVVQ
jgi:hypothetical protein